MNGIQARDDVAQEVFPLLWLVGERRLELDP